MIAIATIGICVVSHGSFTAMNGTNSAMNGTIGAKVIHFESEMTKQPAALPSHFCCAKDERELRAREDSLDSLETCPHARPE
ncbi:hypothetical protein VH1709_contig00008-0272 [Vibrio harveyi]|uniref:hypothetical protein n=1 Tax=Vibrio harveyi TaxID=669 RepID=UPI000D78B083|nr:hypothetical protein [Vibrio harveyi]GBK97427.1 hypothetical protein VH1709_contig00008-0272 [Vibrio harveyi]